ncbi:MAG: YneF family protein [Solobacterium sp.]|nr:YneF family protein [Solobacterium sp.]
MSVGLTSLLWFIAGGLVGAAISFYFTRKNFEKQLKENPPINEKMIRAMFLQMGRKPSEAQIRQIMKSMNQGQ